MKGERKGILGRLIRGLRMEKGEAVMDDELFERLVRDARGEGAEEEAGEGAACGEGEPEGTKEEEERWGI